MSLKSGVTLLGSGKSLLVPGTPVRVARVHFAKAVVDTRARAVGRHHSGVAYTRVHHGVQELLVLLVPCLIFE